MNLFVLDLDPRKCAQYHCDKHVVKMITETAQMLSTAHWYADDGLYMDPRCMSPSYDNHPCTKWVRESVDNYNWTRDLGLALCEEFRFRFTGYHLNESVIRVLGCPSLPDVGPTVRPRAFGTFQIEEPCVVQAYRSYYLSRKATLATWVKGREEPFWWRPGKPLSGSKAS